MEKRINRWLSALLALVMLLTGAATAASAEGAEKKMTVMLYLCGSNLETYPAWQGTGTIDDIISSRYNLDDVNVVALLGGAVSWMYGYDASQLTVLQIGGRRPKTVTTLPSASMGDPATLLGFMQYCHDNYPAERNALVIWNHGGGPIYGVCQDSLFKGDTLGIDELVQALADGPFGEKGLESIVFNCCLMSSAEVALQIAPYAQYMVGSEDSMYGLAYEWLSGAEALSALDTAKAIVDTSFERNGQIIERQSATEINAFAVVDLSRLDGVVQAMDQFFPNVTATLNNDSFTMMSGARRDTMSFGIGDSGDVHCSDLIDLGDITNRYHDMDPAAADALLSAIDEAVVYSRLSTDRCHGLTVYHPYLNKDQMKDRIGVYNDMPFSEEYKAYIRRFASILTDTPLADWTNLTASTPDATRAMATLFNLKLTDDQRSHFGAASMSVLLKDEGDTYSFANSAQGAAMNDEGELTATYDGTSIYVVDGEDNPLSFPLQYVRVGEYGVQIPAELTGRATEDGEPVTVQARVRCEYDPQTQTYAPGSISLWDEEMGHYTSARSATLQDFDSIRLTRVHRSQTRDAAGALMAFDLWDEVSRETCEFAIDGSWRFKSVEDSLDTTSLYAAFQVIDSQNNVYCSEPLVVKSQMPDVNVLRLNYENSNVFIDKCQCRMDDGALILSMNVTNRLPQEAIVRLENLKLDGVDVDAVCEAYGTGDNWGLLQDECQVLFLKLTADQLPQIDVVNEITFDLNLIDAASDESLAVVPVSTQKTINL